MPATTVAIRMPDTLRSSLEKKAQEEERSFSDVVRRACRSYVQKDDAKDQK